MPTTRRQFIKQSAGAVSVSMLMPKLLLARGQDTAAVDPNRKIFLLINWNGANDGLNTVVPYANARYKSLRPNLAFNENEFNAGGVSTIINNELAFHPSLVALKGLWDEGKVATVLGVGYPTPNLSHFSSTSIWMTGSLNAQGAGWIGKYADLALVGKSGLSAVSINNALPQIMFANKVVIPNITPSNNATNLFSNYTYQTDGRNGGDRNNQLNSFRANTSRVFDAGTFLAALADASFDAEAGATQVQNTVSAYRSTVTYPAAPNPLSNPLKMVAQLAATIPEANIFNISFGGFDTHSAQITSAGGINRATGQHANLLRYVAEGIKAFLDDMAVQGLADNVMILTYSEFGRRPNENASFGTDHGTAAPLFVVGNKVKGGLYGAQPSLEATSLDRAGNMVFTTDFRSVYATILEKWLPDGSSTAVLGTAFPHLGFL
jgi:uncharacterized protein (DUF1501 family)